MYTFKLDSNAYNSMIEALFNKNIPAFFDSREKLKSISPDDIPQDDLRDAFIKKDYYTYYKIGYEKYLKNSNEKGFLSFLKKLKSNPNNLPFVDVLDFFRVYGGLLVIFNLLIDQYDSIATNFSSYKQSINKIANNIIKTEFSHEVTNRLEYFYVNVGLDNGKGTRVAGKSPLIDPEGYKEFLEFFGDLVASKKYKQILSYFFDDSFRFKIVEVNVEYLD